MKRFMRGISSFGVRRCRHFQILFIIFWEPRIVLCKNTKKTFTPLICFNQWKIKHLATDFTDSPHPIVPVFAGLASCFSTDQKKLKRLQMMLSMFWILFFDYILFIPSHSILVQSVKSPKIIFFLSSFKAFTLFLIFVET